MTLTIISIETGYSIYHTDGEQLKSVIPYKGEMILINQSWNEVVERVISFRDVPTGRGYSVLDQTVYLWVKKINRKDVELGVLPEICETI